MQLPFLVLSVAAAVLRVADTTPPRLPEPLPDTTVTTTAPPTESVEEVLVEAPEPRYVAPNRRDRIGRVWAPVLINGKGPFRLVLDTGASGAAVIQSVVTRLGISTANARTVRLQGVTGSAIVSTIPVDTIEVGDLLLQGKHLPIVPDAFGGAEGVLGGEGLRDMRIAIDFRHDEISIMRSRKQRMEGGFTAIPLTFSRNGLPTLEASIGTIRIRAILDTGAQVTVGNNALRDLLKRRRADSGMTEIVGVTLDVAQGQVIPVSSLHIGRIEVRGLRLTFGDMSIFELWKLQREPVLLIGMDIVGSFDAMVIDYPKRELQIRTRGGA
jgi:predicted aspartyl protease